MLQATVHSALNLVGTSTATMAQQGSIFTTLSANKTVTKPWIIDSGVSDHMTGDITTFDKYRSYNEGATVWIADGSFSIMASIGSVIISKEIRLDSVLFVPKLDYNLLSISKITKDLNCVTKFSQNVCDFQVLNSGKAIGNAKMSAWLYLLRFDAQERQTKKFSCVVLSQNKDGAECCGTIG